MLRDRRIVRRGDVRSRDRRTEDAMAQSGDRSGARLLHEDRLASCLAWKERRVGELRVGGGS